MEHMGLVKTIQDCEITCEHMGTMVLRMSDVHARRNQLLLLRDCADICTLSAKLIARNSYVEKSVAELCAHICEICGNECLKFPDSHSQRCAQICLHCAQQCRAFARSRLESM
ncbi:ferredoxin [Bacillus canaveralius]|uniref:Ferredoxin n=2 Tax=Bacillaceae TaxID=186817 RepID=A0A2N5GLB1_9BACI|nr:ferredoxin [Bacillus canaveralius]PLR84020.1 ferredoxin [Bacillus sp. V33-4]PLR98059.1 ferredoxin [Bacillus canaveralius]